MGVNVRVGDADETWWIEVAASKLCIIRGDGRLEYIGDGSPLAALKDLFGELERGDSRLPATLDFIEGTIVGYGSPGGGGRRAERTG